MSREYCLAVSCNGVLSSLSRTSACALALRRALTVPREDCFVASCISVLHSPHRDIPRLPGRCMLLPGQAPECPCGGGRRGYLFCSGRLFGGPGLDGGLGAILQVFGLGQVHAHVHTTW